MIWLGFMVIVLAIGLLLTNLRLGHIERDLRSWRVRYRVREAPERPQEAPEPPPRSVGRHGRSWP